MEFMVASHTEALVLTSGKAVELLQRVRFLDVEASGLHRTSFPIEVGWCGLDLKPVSMLIKPTSNWTIQDWSFDSERVHNISWQMLQEEGREARECALEIAEAMRGCIVASDAPAFDGKWIATLFAETDVTPTFKFVDVELIWAQCAKIAVPRPQSVAEFLQRMEDVAPYFPHTHRAGEDALGMAAAARALYDTNLIETVRKP